MAYLMQCNSRKFLPGLNLADRRSFLLYNMWMYSQVTVYAIMHYYILLKISPPPLFDLQILAQVFYLTYKPILMLQKLHCQQKKIDHVKVDKDTVFFS